MSLDLVGRVDELAALEAAWMTAAAAKVAPVMVVYGEPGIGKTRTVAEMARALRGRGAEVWWGTAYEGEGARPYAVWAEAIAGYVDRVGDEGLVSALGDAARWLSPLLAGVGLADVERVNVPAEVARLRLAETFVRVLDSFECPPVVVLDDLQWAYPESLELFALVSRLAAGSLVVVCCRGIGLELGHPLAQRVAEVHRQRGCEYVALGSLSREEARELLEQAAGGPLEPEVIDAAYEESRGNPFFLGELGRHVHREGGDAAVGGGRPLPESIRGAVGLRLVGLSAQTRYVLQLASVFTAGFEFAELQALSELEEGVLLECLEQALSEELVRPLEGERYDFAHALVRYALYERLSPSRRARLHRRLAEALERLHEQDCAVVARELARHYHASATLPGADRGTRHALTAARQARTAGASGEAVMMLRLGLDLVAAEDTAMHARMLAELAPAEAEAGLSEEASRSLAAAVSLLERNGAPGEEIAELVHEVGAAFAFAVALRSLHAIQPLIARGIAAVGQRHGLAWARLKLLYRYAPPEAVGPLRVIRPVQLDREAVRIARGEGTEADYAFTLGGWDPSLGAEVEELLARIDGWRDPVARLRAQMDVMGHLALVEPDNGRAADRLSTELCALADDVGLVPHRVLARVLRAALVGGRGELKATAEQIAQARAALEGQPAPGAMLGLVTVVGELTAQHVAADWPRLAEAMWDLARRPMEVGWLSLTCAGLAAHAFACAGEGDRAREILGYLLPALELAETLEPTTSSAIGLAGAAVCELHAKDLAQRLLPHAVAFADGDGPDFYMTSAELTVARLCAVLGRFDQAVEYFAQARVTLERRDQRVLRAIVDYDEALARVVHKRRGAARLLALASARFRQLGMTEWSRRAALVDVPDTGLPDRLTAREAEILRLVAFGRTNKEMAAELVLSVHTVERHVQNAYRKIDARNRADASTYVARVGL
jgi:DNA-binding CsgD family transcriptional regulator